MLINGKHIGPPIKSSFKSIDSVMEHSESVVINGDDGNAVVRERKGVNGQNADLMQIFNNEEDDDNGRKEQDKGSELAKRKEKKDSEQVAASNMDFGAAINRA